MKMLAFRAEAPNWYEVDDALGEFTSLEDRLKELNYEVFSMIGVEFQNSITLYQGDADFLISYGSYYSWRIIYCPNFGDALEFLRLYGPTITATQLSEMAESVDEIFKLLKGPHGPLEDAHVHAEREDQRVRERMQEKHKSAPKPASEK